MTGHLYKQKGPPPPTPSPSQVLKVPAQMPSASGLQGAFLSFRTCSRPCGRHSSADAQRHPPRTGGVASLPASCLRFGCQVFPEVPLQPCTHTPCHFRPRAPSQQDQVAPRHKASCRWKDTWCILPASPRGSAHLPVVGCPVLPDHTCPLPCCASSAAAANERHLHIHSHCRGLCQHRNASMKKPLSASPRPTLHLDRLPVLSSPPLPLSLHLSHITPFSSLPSALHPLPFPHLSWPLLCHLLFLPLGPQTSPALPTGPFSPRSPYLATLLTPCPPSAAGTPALGSYLRQLTGITPSQAPPSALQGHA